MSPQEQLQDSSAEDTLTGAQQLFRELTQFSRLQERRTAVTGQAGMGKKQLQQQASRSLFLRSSLRSALCLSVKHCTEKTET